MSKNKQPPKKETANRITANVIRLVKKPKYYIGIDTGVNTGVAIWNTETREFIFINTIKIHNALSMVETQILAHGVDNVFIIVEDARKRKFDKGLTDEKRQGAGYVKRDAVVWEDFLSDLGANCKFVAPNGRLNSLAKKRELWEVNCKWNKRTSEHARCAALLVLNS